VGQASFIFGAFSHGLLCCFGVFHQVFAYALPIDRRGYEEVQAGNKKILISLLRRPGGSFRENPLVAEVIPMKVKSKLQKFLKFF
jgi:hypothetical protein